jgi:hypothetical protein
MVKKYMMTLLVAFGAATCAMAQEVTLEGLSARSFTGVKSINNGEFYYTFYFGEKTETKGMANFILAIYDADLKPVKTTNIEISKNSQLAASAFNGKYFLFIFADLNKNKRTTVSLDKGGNIVKQNVEEDVRAALLVPENYPDILTASEDDFIVLRPEKEKKFGFNAERIDKDLNVKWTKPFFPEHGMWSVEDSRIAGGKVFILRKEKETMLGERYTYTVQGINIDNGDALFATELKDEDDGGFPEFINVTDDGNVVTGGMYFKNSKYDDKNSDGLFFAVIGMDGKISKMSKTSWKKIKDDIKGDFSSGIYGGKTKVLIEDIIRKKDGNYMIVAETWRKSNDADNTGAGGVTKLTRLGGFGGGGTKTEAGDKGFTVMDFAFFNFNANGELTSIDKVEKTTREAIIKGKLADGHGLEMAQALHKRKFFCYRSCIEVSGKQYIMYKNDDGYKSKAYFLPVGNTTTTGLPFIDMDKWMPENLNKLGQISKWTGGNKYTFDDEDHLDPNSGNPELYKNIIPAKPGYVLLYQFFNGKMSIWLQPVPQG